MHTKELIESTNLFSQVFETSDGQTTYVSRSRGVMMVVERLTTRVYVDCYEQTWYSPGRFTTNELLHYVMPVVESESAMDYYRSMDRNDRDFTIARDHA